MHNHTTSPEESILTEQDLLTRDYDKHLKQARNAILVVAAVQFVFGLVLGFQAAPATRVFTIGLLTVISLIFLGLGWWANKKPYTAILAALIFYGSLLVLDALFDPMTLLRGIIFKVIIIVYLLKGLKNAKEAQELKGLLG